MFIGRTDAEAETPILWPPDAKNWLIWKDPDAGKDWRRDEKGTTEDEMVGWHHWLNGHEFEQALGVVDGKKSLVSCSPWGRKELGTTEWLNLAFPFFSRGSSHPRDQTQVFHIAGGFFTSWATREAHVWGMPLCVIITKKVTKDRSSTRESKLTLAGYNSLLSKVHSTILWEKGQWPF